jgi:ribonuclease HII
MGKIIKYKIGIDEVGRGPVAGPVAVGGVFYDVNLEKELLEELKGMTDSKKISEKKREIFFEKIKILKEEKYMNSKKIFSSVVFVSAKDIDSFGIVPSIQKALNFVLENILKNKELQKIDIDEIKVLLDGGLKAPEKFKNQETIIKGDQKEFSISCASVVAKVLRDKKMKEYGNKFPQYYFEKHKGYGTKLHMESIKKHGISELHRKTFLKKIF